jgi:glycosyltransferase involved in cell wall biosynthesis
MNLLINNEIIMKKEIPKVSIGLPVYNGEKFIVKKIESLLAQTFKDFELIISDNASTDKSAKICKKYALTDKRIKNFNQSKNIGAGENFNFVLDKARGEFFLWSAVDDIILPTFIEKNIKILEINPNVVCSASKMKLYGEKTISLETKSNDTNFKNKMKKIQRDFGHMDTFPATGSYEKRIKEYFKNLRHNQIFYGIFRTNQIKQVNIRNPFLMSDACIILKILKFGELSVVNEVLMETYDGGISRKGMLGVIKHLNHKKIGTIFPYYNFTLWCFRNLSSKIFLKNLGFFIKVNCIGLFSIGIDVIRRINN